MADIDPLIRVSDVRVVTRYVVEVTFADGAIKVIDLQPHLWGEMFEPMLRDYDLFCKVEVDPRAGTISWPNGADLSPRMLYGEGEPAGAARQS